MGMRAAIVHYWLLNWRGGEKVLESLCRLLPDADIFTLFYDPRAVSPEIRRHNVTASFLNPLRRYYRELLPLMPLALEQFDLRGYDLVISSESGPAKGVITSASTRPNVTASFLNPLRRYYRELLPLMPLALEQFDLRGYDLVISSESGPAKGVITSSSTRHICYCHTPMRYIWDLYPAYAKEWLPAWKRGLFAPVSNYLRLWDYASAARVDEFIANSD